MSVRIRVRVRIRIRVILQRKAKRRGEAERSGPAERQRKGGFGGLPRLQKYYHLLLSILDQPPAQIKRTIGGSTLRLLVVFCEWVLKRGERSMDDFDGVVAFFFELNWKLAEVAANNTDDVARKPPKAPGLTRFLSWFFKCLGVETLQQCHVVVLGFRETPVLRIEVFLVKAHKQIHSPLLYVENVVRIGE